MAPRSLLIDEQTRLLRIAGLMPLASVSNLAPILGIGEQNVRRMLGRLRHGGFHHAVARYGPDVWTPFIYATERILRRKEQHRLWGVDAYLHEEDRYLRIANRVFYEDLDQQVSPSARVVVAADAWAAELARRTLTGSTPTLIWAPGLGYGGHPWWS